MPSRIENLAVIRLFDELCDDTVENFVIDDSSSDDRVLVLMGHKHGKKQVRVEN